MTTSVKHWRLFIFVFFISIFGVTFYRTIWMLVNYPTHLMPEEWIIGDWLINYQGGMTRRGLMGELTFRLSHILGFNQITLILLILFILYGYFLFNVYRLSIDIFPSPINATLIMSPAFILFPVLDSNGLFRKEILFFAFLSLLCWHLVSCKKISNLIPILIGTGSIFIVLNHEMLVFYLPYLILAIILHEGELGPHAKRTIIFIAPAILITLLLFFGAKGNEKISTAICASIRTYAPLDCINPNILGSISFLSKDMLFAHNFVLATLTKETLTVYGLLTILSFMPLFLVFYTNHFNVFLNKQVRFWLSVFVFSSLISTIPLFWFVADYGRIVHIHIVSLSVIALMAMQKKNEPSLFFAPNLQATWIISLIFISSWRLIVWKANIDNAFPVLGYVIHIFQH